MKTPAATQLEELAGVNLRSRKAQIAELPRAREAACSVRREMLESRTNPFNQISATSASRAATFAVRLCESALDLGLRSDLKMACWLVIGLDFDSDNRTTIHYCAAVIQATRIIMDVTTDEMEEELNSLEASDTWDFLRKFLHRPDNPSKVLAAYGITLSKDAEGSFFRQNL